MPDSSSYFDAIFHNARVNGIIVLDKKGIIKKVNDAFLKAYGYTEEDLVTKHFRLLFTKKDCDLQKPENELSNALLNYAANDENYIVRKDGAAIWVTGETIRVDTEDEVCVVKIIHNIHAQKQLEHYLLASSALLDTLFDSVHSGLLLLDGQMRIIKSNSSFAEIFQLTQPVAAGSKIQDIPHDFWKSEGLRNDIRNVLVNGEKLDKIFTTTQNTDTQKKLRITSKIMLGEEKLERRLLVVVDQAE